MTSSDNKDHRDGIDGADDGIKKPNQLVATNRTKEKKKKKKLIRLFNQTKQEIKSTYKTNKHRIGPETNNKENLKLKKKKKKHSKFFFFFFDISVLPLGKKGQNLQVNKDIKVQHIYLFPPFSHPNNICNYFTPFLFPFFTSCKDHNVDNKINKEQHWNTEM